MSWFDYNYIIEKETLTAIADAIREKRGEAFLGIDPVDMPQKIRGIQSGSTGGGDMDALIDRSITEVSSGVTSIGSYAFENCKELTSANFPNATGIGGDAFRNCFALANANFPNATRIGDFAFNNCYVLTSADFPKVTSIGDYAFSTCKELANADFPKATGIGAVVFQNCYVLKSLILRSETVCTLSNTNAFIGCYHILGTKNSTYNPNGDKDGYIYVPANLVDAYKTATNWSTYASQIRAIEGEGGGEEDGNWLFQNEQIDSNGRNDLPIPTTGVSYTLFVDGAEIATSTAESNWDGSTVLRFNTEDYSIYFIYDASTGSGWHFHPMDSQVTSGSVSVRINTVNGGGTIL